MPLGQTVTVLNKSGKVVSTTKHLASVWKEAKAAYLSRKAEINAKKSGNPGDHHNRDHESHLRRGIQNISLSDEHLPRHGDGSRSVHRSKTTARRGDSYPVRNRSMGLERGYTDTAFANDVVYQRPDLAMPDRELTRRNSTPGRPTSSDSFDEHLAYGQMSSPMPLQRSTTEKELKGKMVNVNRILEEADCLHYTATTTIQHLQKNPEALAAVGLALAEISAMVSKVGPSALFSMKTAFPAVVALLASPEFLIAGGVAVGVTIVMLGGYKIIKQLKNNKKETSGSEVTELREINGDLSRIEMWRRGIADAESQSVGTSVDGEFITPQASRRLIEEGVLAPEQVRRPNSRRAGSESSRRHRRARSDGEKTEGTSKTGRPHRSRTVTSSSTRRTATSKAVSSSQPGKRQKAVSGIKMLFGGRRLPAVV